VGTQQRQQKLVPGHFQRRSSRYVETWAQFWASLRAEEAWKSPQGAFLYSNSPSTARRKDYLLGVFFIFVGLDAWRLFKAQ